MNTARTYSSPLRAEHAALTRDRIVDAAVDLLSRGDSADITMQDVAQTAGVSLRTVYRNFATRDELFDGVVSTIGQRVVTMFGPRPATSEDYVESTREVVRKMADLEPLYRALFATQAGREAHQRSAGNRRVEIAAAYAAELEHVDEQRAVLFSALIHLATSTPAALFLKDYWQLDDNDVSRALQWLVRVLTDAIHDPGARDAL